MTDRQNRILASIANDGERCFKKGLGITKSGKYDYAMMDRCISLYIAYNDVRGFDKEEVEKQWMAGWYYAQEQRDIARYGDLGFDPNL